MNQNEQMRELCRRLYVELYHCDKQMTSTLDDEGEQLWKTGKTVSDVLADAKQALAAEPAPNTLGYAQGIEAAAKMLDTKADDYAGEFGFGDMGGLEFSREAHREYHSTLIELAEEVRAMVGAKPAPLVRLTDEDIKQAILSQAFLGFSLMSMISENVKVDDFRKALTGIANALQDAWIAKNGGKV